MKGTDTASTSRPQSLKGSIYAALKQVITKYQILSAIVLNEDKSHLDVYFARLPSIDLRRCVEFSRRKSPEPRDGELDAELEQLLTEQHDRNFKDNVGSPFWRFAVLTSSSNDSTFTAAWIFHHALADGSSALLFHETFILPSMPSMPSSLVLTSTRSSNHPLLLSHHLSKKLI
jgi:hypothetical protein